MKTLFVILLLALCGGAGTALAAAEPARVCVQAVVSATTRGPIRDTVSARAIVVWAAEATSGYTLRYSNWSNATNRNVSCRRYTSSIGLNMWECTATATPCRLR